MRIVCLADARAQRASANRIRAALVSTLPKVYLYASARVVVVLAGIGERGPKQLGNAAGAYLLP